MKLKWLFLVAFCLLLAGCQPNTEIGDMAVVVGVAVAQSSDNQLTVSVELAYRDSINGEDKSSIVTAEGADWPSVEEALAEQCDKRLYWGHTILLLIDENCAARRRAALLEQFYLDQTLAPTIYTALFSGGTELLGLGFAEAACASQGVAHRLSLAQDNDTALCFTVERCVRRIYREETLLMAVLEATEDGCVFRGVTCVAPGDNGDGS